MGGDGPGSGLRDHQVRVTGLDGNGIERPLGNASVELVPGQDLALLHVRARNLPEAPLAERVPPDNASVVALLWEPGGVPEPVTADLVPTDQARFGGLLTARVGVEEGNSGSGLFDVQLRLAGIVVNRIDARRALAVPAAWIKPAVDLRRRPAATEAPQPLPAPPPPSSQAGGEQQRSVGAGGTGLTVPLDRDTTVAAFRTQADRDQTGREAILKYFSDLPSNIEVRLGQVSLTEFAHAPSFVALKAPVTLRVRPEYVERGHALFRNTATQDVEPPRGWQPTVFALCAAPAHGEPVLFGFGGSGTRASSLNCRGVPASQALLANIVGIEKKNEALLGEGFRNFVTPMEAQRVQMRHQGWDVSPGVAFGIEVLDASGGVVAGAYNKMFTQCHRFLTSYMTNSDEWMRSEAFRGRGRADPTVNLFDDRLQDRQSATPPGYSPATCVLLQGGRYIGSTQAAPEQRTMLALLPKAAIEQAAKLRTVLTWD